MRYKELAAGAALLISVSGCATAPEDVQASFVTPVLYSNLTCDQLALEATRVSQEVANLTGQQRKRTSRDTTMTAVGVIVFWPALLAVRGDGATAASLASAKGQMTAIEQAATQKNCGIDFRMVEVEPPPPDYIKREKHPLDR